MGFNSAFISLNAEINPMCHMLSLLRTHHILHVGRIRVNILNFSNGQLDGFPVECVATDEDFYKRIDETGRYLIQLGHYFI